MVKRVVRMPRARGPGGVHERVLEILLDVVDELPRRIVSVELPRAGRKTPDDWNVRFPERRPNVIGEQANGLVERGIAGAGEIFPSAFLGLVELGLNEVHQGAHFGIVGIRELITFATLRTLLARHSELAPFYRLSEIPEHPSPSECRDRPRCPWPVAAPRESRR